MRARTPALAASGAARSLPSRPPARRRLAGAGGQDPCGGSRRGLGGEGSPAAPRGQAAGLGAATGAFLSVSPGLRAGASLAVAGEHTLRATPLQRGGSGDPCVCFHDLFILFPLELGEGSLIRPCVTAPVPDPGRSGTLWGRGGCGMLPAFPLTERGSMRGLGPAAQEQGW